MSTAIRVAIVGAAGRMGQSLLENGAAHEEIEVVAALVGPNYEGPPELGPQKLKPLSTLEDLQGSLVDVIVDFSSPKGCLKAANYARKEALAFVSGTTGHSSEELQELQKIAREIPLLLAANFSVGVNLLSHLVERAAQGIGDSVDIEIFEAHHRRKLDAPSGTALMLGEAAARGRDLELDEVALVSREGHTGPRHAETIGFQVLRGGDIVGEHTVYFCVDGERLELTHRATDRGIFARGALRAARWVAHKSPGRYEMADVLFSKSK